MPSTAPTLTWDMTITRNSATPTSPQAALDTLELLVGDAIYWKKDTGAFGSGAGAGFLIITPVGGNQPDMQIVFCFGPDNAMINAKATATNKTLIIFMGLCPDGGADSDPLLAAGPCDSSGERFTEFMQITSRLDNDPADTIFSINSDESFSVWLREDIPIDWYGGIAGAIIDPPTDADGEGTPGRIYGMAVTQTSEIQNSFWASSSEFMSTNNGTNNSVVQCFNPGATTTLISLDRFIRTMGDPPRFLTQFGTQISMPVSWHEESAPFNLIGIGRQMRVTTDGTMRQVIQDGASADKSYYVSAHDSDTWDTLSFDNG